MDENDWLTFFELVDKIVNMEGTASDKRVELEAKAEEFGSHNNLLELVAWIDA